MQIDEALENTPRTHDALATGIEVGMGIIEGFLQEMLGTFEDKENFKKMFRDVNPFVYESIYKKCEGIRKDRENTVKILRKVRKREKALFELKGGKISQKIMKENVEKICRLSKELRKSICLWIESETTPFYRFYFRGQDYLKKIDKDTLLLQEYLC